MMAVPLLLPAQQPPAQRPAKDITKLTAEVPAVRSTQPFSEGFLCNNVQRSARLLNPTPKIGEPLLFELRFEGHPRGPEPADFAQAIRIGADIRVYVQPSNGRPYEYKPSRQVSSFAPNFAMQLRDNEVITLIMTMAYDPDTVTGAMFDFAGDYLFTITMECQEPTVVQPQTEVLGEFLVRPEMPQRGDIDLLALNTLVQPKDPTVFMSIQNMDLIDPKHAEYFISVIENAPDSALRPWALLVLGNSQLVKYHVSGDKGSLPAAAKAFEQYLRDHPAHPMRGIISLRLVDTYAAMGETDRSRQLALAVWRDPEYSHLIRPGSDLYKSLAGEPHAPVTGDWMMFEKPSDAMKPDSGAEGLTNEQNQQVQEAIREALRQAQQPGTESGAPRQ